MAARQFLLIGMLFALAVGSAWLIHVLDPGRLAPVAAPAHVPDFYLDKFTTVHMDGEGNPKRRLEGARLAHYPDTDSNEIRAPYMVLYHPTREPWHVRAERGWVSGAGDVILLLGEVHVWRDSSSHTREVDIRTRDLRVLPQSEYGETDKPVVIRTRNAELRAVGMRAWLDDNRIELLSQVQSVYERTTP
jgi:lipopolysaccharide export system protein LptC